MNFVFLTIIILFLNGRNETANVMESEKAFKHSAELREYWRLEKRKQIARRARKEGVSHG